MAYLVQPEHVQDVLRFLHGRHGNKPLRSACDLAMLLMSVARHRARDALTIGAF